MVDETKFGDTLVACARCGNVCVGQNVVAADPKPVDLTKLGAGQSFKSRPCRACGNGAFRMLVGPLFIARPEPKKEPEAAVAEQPKPSPSATAEIKSVQSAASGLVVIQAPPMAKS